MKHYPKLTEQGSITRPHQPPHARERAYRIYDDIGRWLGTVTAWDIDYAKAMADHHFGPHGWASLAETPLYGLGGAQ